MINEETFDPSCMNCNYAKQIESMICSTHHNKPKVDKTLIKEEKEFRPIRISSSRVDIWSTEEGQIAKKWKENGK